ncbi:ferredoxin--NADP reductase [Mycolicibacterium confluentis]|uniref:3-ketosteroid-9-alpha-hydroxylase reductase subunit n=1 Tax=Mycolicibacterium confluentis TaxID=28047 RepID=A0A7I7Y7P9_9MYCO|nr:ferredoxin--NADP reductase [Mycolicibacterium confluentis]MCV7318593.1 ferredoxin--NADP reductase [Mycolicibacterium confluentis]BBZ36921.1 3-ketosteroid-9-alpha-hydroxylase reductase subunit [Mycolicibacterium confluentis]
MTQPVQLRVVSVTAETDAAKSFRLRAPESLSYKPGQFLTIGIPSDRGMVARCYSMSSAPHEDDVTITVKRTPQGFASNWLCDNVTVGDTLTALPPSGNFVPPAQDADLLLFAAGSGITPVMSIAKYVLMQTDRRVALFYANRDSAAVIFAEQLRAMSEDHPERLHIVHWLEELQSLPRTADLQRFASVYPHYFAYTCGPEPFMNAVTDALHSLGFPSDRFKREVFLSLSGNPFEIDEVVSGPGANLARVKGSCNGASFAFDDWPSDVPLLQYLLSKGVDAPFSCRNGECGACCFQLIDGTVEMECNDVLDSYELAEGYRLACQAKPASKSITITYA